MDSILASIEGDLSRDEMQIATLLREFAYAVDAHELPAPITSEGLGLLRNEFMRAIQELGRSCGGNGHQVNFGRHNRTHP